MGKNKYIILFFTQYGAINYSKKLSEIGIEGVTRPVPRVLSSSCGICVEVDTETDMKNYITEDIEGIYIKKEDEYEMIYLSEE